MLCKAACTLLDWNRPIQEIADITGLTEKDIEDLRHSTDERNTQPT